jgi:predicted 2-oxoglutarate/Fe(II)-dependent dioxygenase YbiX
VVHAFDPTLPVDAAALRRRGIYVRAALLGDDATREVRRAMRDGRGSPAEIVSGTRYVVDRRVRDAEDVEVEPSLVAAVDAAVAGVRRDVADFFSVALTGMEGVGFLRYRAGGRYRPHVDAAPGQRRRIAVVLFLNRPAGGASGAPGGELRLHDSTPFDIVPAAGALVAFEATRRHEVRPLHADARDVAVTWFY